MNYKVDVLKTRLDKFLSETVKSTSRSQIQRDIEAGKVFVNGSVVKESKFVVRKDDKVDFKGSLSALGMEQVIKPSNTPLKVLYDDHGLLIIDKPAGMTVHPGAGFKGETLASALLYHFSAQRGSASGGQGIKLVGEEGRPGIVHRLDKDTSGVILVAKTQSMYEYLKDAFFERKVKKEYIALVQGRVEKSIGRINLPIGKSKNDFRKMDVKNVIEPKEALTEYRVLEYLSLKQTTPSASQPPLLKKEGNTASGVDECTLILVKLHTGRTHQIRVHMKAIGHPLMGDSLYGSKKTQIKGLNRQFLHAKKIEVQLPDRSWIEAESELADDLKEALNNLGSKIVKQL